MLARMVLLLALLFITTPVYGQTVAGLLNGFYGAAWGSTVEEFPGGAKTLLRQDSDLLPCPGEKAAGLPEGKRCFIDKLSGLMIEEPYMQNLERVVVLTPLKPLLINGVTVDKARYIYYKNRLSMIYLDHADIQQLRDALAKDLGKPHYKDDKVTAWMAANATLEEQVARPGEVIEVAVFCDSIKNQVAVVHSQWYFEMSRINTNIK